MKKLLVLIAICAALFASLVAQAQVYKWVDKDGKVQYSDQPPPPGASKADAQKVTSVVTTVTSGGSSAPGKTLQDRAKESDKARSDGADKQKKDDDAAKIAQQNQEACNSAKQSLKTLQAGGRITTTGADGEKTLMDDDQIQQEVGKAQKAVADACK
jgi:hypothetical protein